VRVELLEYHNPKVGEQIYTFCLDEEVTDSIHFSLRHSLITLDILDNLEYSRFLRSYNSVTCTNCPNVEE
jgi:hypothetical protein